MWLHFGDDINTHSQNTSLIESLVTSLTIIFFSDLAAISLTWKISRLIFHTMQHFSHEEACWDGNNLLRELLLASTDAISDSEIIIGPTFAVYLTPFQQLWADCYEIWHTKDICGQILSSMGWERTGTAPSSDVIWHSCVARNCQWGVRVEAP